MANIGKQRPEGKINEIRWLGTESGKTGCPSVFETDRGTFLVQGWKVADPDVLARLAIPDHETVVEIPNALIGHLPKEDRGPAHG